MSDEKEVEFIDEGADFTERSKVQKAASAMADWLIKVGAAKSEESANRMLISVAIVFFLITGFIIFRYIL